MCVRYIIKGNILFIIYLSTFSLPGGANNILLHCTIPEIWYLPMSLRYWKIYLKCPKKFHFLQLDDVTLYLVSNSDMVYVTSYYICSCWVASFKRYLFRQAEIQKDIGLYLFTRYLKIQHEPMLANYCKNKKIQCG